jgi:hypothetical protein
MEGCWAALKRKPDINQCHRGIINFQTARYGKLKNGSGPEPKITKLI